MTSFFKDYLWQMLKQSEGQVPVEICIVALEVLLAVARHLTLRDTLINSDTIDTICFLLEVKKLILSHFFISQQ